MRDKERYQFISVKQFQLILILIVCKPFCKLYHGTFQYTDRRLKRFVFYLYNFNAYALVNISHKI